MTETELLEASKLDGWDILDATLREGIGIICLILIGGFLAIVLL